MVNCVLMDPELWQRLVTDLMAHPEHDRMNVEVVDAPRYVELQERFFPRLTGVGSFNRQLLGAVVVELKGEVCLQGFFQENERALVQVANDVQTFLLEELREAWPPCLMHAAPLEPTLVNDEAYWACTSGGRQSCRMGRLALISQG